jgi:hypothetical protein
MNKFSILLFSGILAFNSAVLADNANGLYKMAEEAVIGANAIRVTQGNNPELYEYARFICQEAGLQQLPVFITPREGFMWECVQSLFSKAGTAIIVPQTLIEQGNTTPMMVAEQVGYIKHEYMKNLLTHLFAPASIIIALAIAFCPPVAHVAAMNKYLAIVSCATITTGLLFGQTHDQIKRDVDLFAMVAHGKWLIKTKYATE